MTVEDDAVLDARREIEKARVRFDDVCVSAQLALDALKGQKRKPLAVGTSRGFFHLASFATGPGGADEPGTVNVRADLSTWIPSGQYDVVVMVYPRDKKTE